MLFRGMHLKYTDQNPDVSISLVTFGFSIDLGSVCSIDHVWSPNAFVVARKSRQNRFLGCHTANKRKHKPLENSF